MDCKSPSARICAKLDLAYPIFQAHSQLIWNSPKVRELYPIYLRTMHMVVRAAVPLMQTALDEAAARAASDPVCAELAVYYRRHLKEEAGHDRWLLEDLRATGADATDFLNAMPSKRIAELVGAQYYWLRHHHPISLLGHITVMENYHPPAGFALYLRDLTGYPEAAFNAIARHELLDVHHRRELLELLNRLPLKHHHEKAIVLSALHTFEVGIDVLNDVRADVHSQPGSNSHAHYDAHKGDGLIRSDANCNGG